MNLLRISQSKANEYSWSRLWRDSYSRID